MFSRLNPRHSRSPKNLLLNDVFTDWDSGFGIFSFLDGLVGVPWEGVDSEGLDIAYHGENSGQKFISPIVYRWLDDDGEIHSEGINKLVSALKARYYQKWTHLWSVYSAEYNPLDTYNLTEDAERHTTVDQDGTSSFTHGQVVTNSGTDTTTTEYGHVITDAGEPSQTMTDQIQGFDSTTFVDRTKSTQENVTDNTTTHSGEDSTDLVHGKVETNSGTDSGSSTNDVSTDDTFSSTKRGLMYRAPAELLKLDRDFWLEDYFSIVFSDVDDMLTLGIYAERTPTTKIF